MEITVSFPGNKKVAAHVGGLEILTDQPAEAGGDSAGPSPYLLFLSSLAACAGYYALEFCRAREIDPGSLKISLSYEWTPEMKSAGEKPAFVLRIDVPPDFDEKQIPALQRAVSACAVKKAIEAGPSFSVVVSRKAHSLK